MRSAEGGDSISQVLAPPQPRSPQSRLFAGKDRCSQLTNDTIHFRRWRGIAMIAADMGRVCGYGFAALMGAPCTCALQERRSERPGP